MDLLIKIFLTAAVVLLVTIVTEKKGGKMGAIFNGFPSAYAIIFLFIGLEHSQEFLSLALSASLLGYFSLFLFEGVYFWGLKTFPFPKITTPFISIVAVLVVNYILQFLVLPFWGSLLFAILCIFAAHFLFRFWQPHDEVMNAKKLTPLEIIFRASLSSAVIVAITASTKIAGPAYAGVLGMFPCILFSSLLILQRHNTPSQIMTLIKHHPVGLMPILGFATTLFVLPPITGFLWAWGLSFVSATVVLLVQMQVRKYF